MAETPINVSQPVPTHTPMPAAVFVKSLRNTEDEVWSKLLVLDHRGENKTLDEWKEELTALKSRSV